MATNVINFFSYKGGAGRSTLAYNTIPILAAEHLHPTKEHPMIIVDMDIDSCGMSYLLEVDKIEDDYCVQSLLEKNWDVNSTASTVRDHPFFQKLHAVGKKFGYHDNEAILFLPAKDNKNVGSNSSNYNPEDPFLAPMKSFISTCEDFQIPAVILDSAVGNNSTANVSNQLSKTIVCCMRPTTQFVNGTVRFLKKQHGDKPNFSGKKTVVVVPNVVPQEKLIIDGQKYPDLAVDSIIDKFRPLLDTQDSRYGISYETGMMDESEFGIPAVKSFMWREGMLYTQDSLNDNEELVLTRYKKLATLIKSHCK